MREDKDIFDRVFDNDGAEVFRTLAEHFRVVMFWSIVALALVYTVEHLKPESFKVLELKEKDNG